jgi:hypothetical protein
MENPRLLAKDAGSGDDGCPSVWLDNGQFTILGPEADLLALKNVLPGETACRISIDVVRRALAAYDQETSG